MLRDCPKNYFRKNIISNIGEPDERVPVTTVTVASEVPVKSFENGSQP